MSPESSKDVIISVIIILIIVIVGYLAYTRGFFNGQQKQDDGSGIEVKIGGGNDDNTQPAQ